MNINLMDINLMVTSSNCEQQWFKTPLTFNNVELTLNTNIAESVSFLNIFGNFLSYFLIFKNWILHDKLFIAKRYRELI